ncbi:MAG: transcriptional regulator, Crp/Fnr family [Nocardioidaceae bacterium]|nr:transcriptional regulator, Crp/Fnr family [Nocardioidaceae bacterium]
MGCNPLDESNARGASWPCSAWCDCALLTGMEWPLLSSLPSEQYEAVLGAARRRRFAKGETVFHEGDPADSLHLVATGRLAVRSGTADGEVLTLNILSPGDYFGELALMRDGTNRVRTATVAALEPAETLVLTALVFHELCTRNPGVESFMSTLLARRVEELSIRLVEALHVSLDRRVYRRLLDLAEIYAPGAPKASIPLTQTNLADLVGGSRPSVNQVLQKLATRGTVILGRGTIDVVDIGELARRARI